MSNLNNNSRYGETHIRRDAWVKSLFKTYEPEALGELIEKRIKLPLSTGPYVIPSQEGPVDIVNALIADGPEGFREKIEPAVGLLLYKMRHGQMEKSNEILQGVFSIIRGSKLTKCLTLVQNWLNENVSLLLSDKAKEQETMREGLMAFAKIQKKDPINEHYWTNLWRHGQACYWPASFHGLRQQNPKLACNELSLLVDRKVHGKLDKAIYLVSGMWNDENARHQLECAIKRGLHDNHNWAGMVLNLLLEKLTEEQRSGVMERLK